jgi:hypothetical protein|tara:strand:+ start:493 stop:702 length:210 start_codon:yes stop_codon:yes gene_type:complete
MTLAAFDPRNLTLYKEPKLLLHFQWQDNSKVYRYALVEIMNEGAINHQNKQKDDEVGLTQKEIWKKKYA